MEGQVPREVMDERLQRLQALLSRHQLEFNQASAGKTCDVLVERKGKHDGQWLGKSPWLQSVWFAEEQGRSAAIGDLVSVDIVEGRPSSLMGELK